MSSPAIKIFVIKMLMLTSPSAMHTSLMCTGLFS